MTRMKEERSDEAPKSRGSTIPVQGENQVPQPREPYERDESSDSQARANSSMERVGAIAHDDLREGRRDTDKGPVLEETYDRLREGEPKKRLP